MASSKAERETLAARIEREIERRAEISVIVEESGDTLVLSGLVDTAEAKQAAGDIAAELAGGKRIDNDLEVEGTLPVEVSEFQHGEAPTAPVPESVAQIREADAEIEPDFTDQKVDTTGLEMAGIEPDEDPDEYRPDESYFAPTDPVITTDSHGEAKVLGGFSATSDESIQVARSASDDKLGDGAIADAVRRELAEDAATTALPIHVVVRDGVVLLRGTVADLEDEENAEEVASRVPGVREVVDELRVEAIE